MTAVSEFPHDLDAERGILGAILIDNGLIGSVADLDPSDFYRRAHEHTFRAALQLAADSKPIDPLTLSDAMSGWSDGCSRAEISTFTDGVPRASHLSTYADIVKRLANERRIAVAASRIVAAGGSLTSALRQEITDALDEPAQAVRESPLVDDVALMNEPRLPELIQGTAPAAGLLFLIGPPACGKTFLAIDAACCVATGQPWLGATVLRRGPVVYVAGEGAGQLGKRIAGWKIAHGVILDEPIIKVWKGAVNLLDGLAVSRLIRELRDVNPIAIVWDTFARCTAGADENSSRDVGLAVSNLDRVTAAFGNLNIVLHHTNKAETSERGSSALRGAADAMLLLTKADLELTLTNDKMKDDPEFPPISIRLVPPYEGSDTLVPRLASDILPSQDLTAKETALLQAMRDSFAITGADHGQWLGACAGVPQRTYYRARHRLIELGYVRQDGLIFRLTGKPLPSVATALPRTQQAACQ